jgi:hypothetical protein
MAKAGVVATAARVIMAMTTGNRLNQIIRRTLGA